MASRLDSGSSNRKAAGFTHDGASHGNTLTLATGQLPRPAVEKVANFENTRGFLHTPVDLILRHAPVLQTIGQVVVDRHVRIERVVLEHHGDIAIGRIDIVDEPVADLDFARGDVFQAGDHPQQGRLAAAGRTDKHDELAVGDIDGDAFDGLHIARIHLPDSVESNR